MAYYFATSRLPHLIGGPGYGQTAQVVSTIAAVALTGLQLYFASKQQAEQRDQYRAERAARAAELAAAQQQEAARLKAMEQQAQAQQAIAGGAGVPMVLGTTTTTGVPAWVWIAGGAVVLGGVALFAVRRR